MTEVVFMVAFLAFMNLVYVYILCGPTQDQILPEYTEKFVIERDTAAKWNETLRAERGGFSGGQSNMWSGMEKNGYDDYNGGSGNGNGWTDDVWGNGKQQGEDKNLPPIEPSKEYRCPPHPPDWITIRSEVNYKYLWLHGNENSWMSATGTLDTPLHHKAFEVVPVMEDCTDGGWVRLRESDNNGFLKMVPPLNASEIETPSVENPFPDPPPTDTWTVHPDSSSLDVTASDESYHFLLEEEGYLLNRKTMAFVNVILPEADVRGHESIHFRKNAARREYNAMMRFQFINSTDIELDREKELKDERVSLEMDAELVAKIKAFPKFTEKRVISFGLYGSGEKYTHGAVKNVEAAEKYFPGWTCRFYCASDVPTGIKSKLKELGAEVMDIPDGEGYISGMFWRFLVASDESVDRFIIRDTDSRMNSRDAMAVQDWVQSEFPVHVLRDHVNHCHAMNGGMWGAVKGALSSMKELITKWENKDQYFADMSFLASDVWPLVENNQLSHDSYCCDRFPNARPFPTQRPPNYQHVGQVFDANDNTRLSDVDGFIRGVPTPHACRHDNAWIYG